MSQACSWTKRDDLQDWGEYAGTIVSERVVKIEGLGAETSLETTLALEKI